MRYFERSLTAKQIRVQNFLRGYKIPGESGDFTRFLGNILGKAEERG
jgi:hypothetical protein